MEEIQIESFKFRLRYPPDLTGAMIYVPPPSPKSQTERNETEKRSNAAPKQKTALHISVF